MTEKEAWLLWCKVHVAGESLRDQAELLRKATNQNQRAQYLIEEAESAICQAFGFWQHSEAPPTAPS